MGAQDSPEAVRGAINPFIMAEDKKDDKKTTSPKDKPAKAKNSPNPAQKQNMDNRFNQKNTKHSSSKAGGSMSKGGGSKKGT